MNKRNGTPPVVVLLERRNERLWINLNTQYWFGANTIHKFLNSNIYIRLLQKKPRNDLAGAFGRRLSIVLEFCLDVHFAFFLQQSNINIWKESPNRTRQKTRCWWLKAPSLKHWKLHSWIECFIERKERRKKSCAQRYHVPSILPSVDFGECAIHNCDCNGLILFKQSDLMVECNFIAQNHSILA